MADLPQLPSPADYEDVGASGTEAPAENKESIFAGILETLQHNNFLLMNLSESADEIEENTESDEGETEKRNRRINEENTDKPGAFSRAIGGLGAGVKGVGGILNKANPFQEGGLGTKMSILLISGVLFAISKFGDKLVKPLAKVLEMFDSEGGVLEKLKNSDLFKGIVETFEKIGEGIKEQFDTIGTDIKTAFEDAKTTFESMGETVKTMGDDVEKLLGAVTTAAGFIKGAYDSVMEYINQFDTRGSGPRNEYGDGKLDAFEMQNLKDDVLSKIKNLVTELVGSMVGGISVALIAFFALGGIGYSIIKGIAMGTAARVTAGLVGTNPSAEGPDKRSSKGSIIKKIAQRTATALTITSGATAATSTVGGAATSALDKPGISKPCLDHIDTLKASEYVKPSNNSVLSVLGIVLKFFFSFL